MLIAPDDSESFKHLRRQGQNFQVFHIVLSWAGKPLNKVSANFLGMMDRETQSL